MSTIWSIITLALIATAALIVIVAVVRSSDAKSYFDAISAWATLVAADTAAVAAIIAIKGLQAENKRAEAESRVLM
jgi:hypothetical protein